MSEETWNRYCQALEELRRLEDETRKRRKGSPTVEVVNKALGVVEGVPVAGGRVTPGVDE